jgi:adenylylsulfate kinase
LKQRGVDAVQLESDILRKIVSDDPHYDSHGRDTFYRLLAWIGALLTQHSVPVIFDATASRRFYREAARREIPHFLEVYVECPLGVCMARDPKGIYQKASSGEAVNVPGIQEAYEPPEMPDVLVRGDKEPPIEAAQRVVEKLREKDYIL